MRGASGKGGNFVETMIRFGREKGALKVVNDQVMSPTSTAFIARAILAFLDRGGAPGVYHCVNTGAVTWPDFARAIVRQAGVPAAGAGLPRPRNGRRSPAARPGARSTTRKLAA